MSGTELPDRHAAWEKATKTAGEVLRKMDGNLKPGKEWRMVVEDEFRQRMFAIHFGAENL